MKSVADSTVFPNSEGAMHVLRAKSPPKGEVHSSSPQHEPVTMDWQSELVVQLYAEMKGRRVLMKRSLAMREDALDSIFESLEDIYY